MLSLKDQIGNIVQITQAPQRIVSLVPSQTELLHYLGLDKEIVGITKFCIRPHEWFQSKKRVGGTKHLHLDCIKKLQPDLIIANKEENTKDDIELLMRYYNVWVSDIHTIKDALAMVEQIGIMVYKQSAAEELVKYIQQKINELQIEIENLPRIKTAYLIWKDPYMTVGGDTFINTMMSMAGLENVFANESRYPTITIEDIKTSDCEMLLLSSEPYPFKIEQVKELKTLLPKINIELVNGEIFSWYGSRLLIALPYLKDWRISLNNALKQLSN